MENCEMSSEMMRGEAPEYSMSFGALVQQSTAILKNECANLEYRIEEKIRDVQELKKLCARGAENISKQQSEFEHYKVKSHSEEIQNKGHISKIHNLREKLKVLDNYFEKWGETINPMLEYNKELKEFINQLQIKLQMKETARKNFEKEYNYYIEEADKSFLELQQLKNQEKTELCELKTHLNNQKEQQNQQEKELELKLREVKSVCREKEIMIEILAPQAAERKKTLEKLKTELASEKEKVFSMNKLEITFHEELNKKNSLAAEIATLDLTISEINGALREKETEINMLDSKQKQLNAEEEEYDKTSKTEHQKVQKLESTVEELTSQLNKLMEIEEENITLKVTFEEIKIESNDYKKKIAEVKGDEEDYCKKIEEMSKAFEGMEIERNRVINEQVVIEDAIKKLQKEQDDNEIEHKDLSLKIDKITAELQEEIDLLKASLQNQCEQVLEASETKKEFEKTLMKLESEFARAKSVSQESDFKLFSQCEEHNIVNKDYIEKIQILSEAMVKIIEDYDDAVSDCKLNEDTKKEVQHLLTDLENKREKYVCTFQQLQESFVREIENKSKVMSECRAQCEREFRNKEVMKTDALVELKETKARIIDLQKQKVLFEKEIVAKADIVKKCDNLIQKLMSKLNKVAQVAIASSQADPVSQQPTFTTPATQRKRVKVESPGSDSSGKTFNPDDVDLKKILHKRQPLWPVPSVTNPQSMPKKKPAAQPKKKAFQEDDWGFLV